MKPLHFIFRNRVILKCGNSHMDKDAEGFILDIVPKPDMKALKTAQACKLHSQLR